MPDITLAIDNDIYANLVELAKARQSPVDNVGAYALSLGLKLLESGLDEEQAILALQEPGTGLDIPLLMAKRKSRGSLEAAAGSAAFLWGRGATVLWHEDELYGVGDGNLWKDDGD